MEILQKSRIIVQIYVYFKVTFSYVLPIVITKFPFIFKKLINYANPELKVIQMWNMRE